MSAQRYTLPAMALHWAMAIIILWLFWLGWTMTDLPKGADGGANAPFVCIEPWYGIMPLAGSTQDIERKEAIIGLGPGAVFRSA